MGSGEKYFGPIGQLIVILATVISGVVILLGQIHGLDKRLALIEYTGHIDRWKAQDQIIWASDLQVRNPTLDVPDSRQIIRGRIQSAFGGAR